MAYGETQFSELKNSFWTLTLKQVNKTHSEDTSIIEAFAILRKGNANNITQTQLTYIKFCHIYICLYSSLLFNDHVNALFPVSEQKTLQATSFIKKGKTYTGNVDVWEKFKCIFVKIQ